MKYRKYAPILHTAFREKYADGIVEKYAKHCADMGYSGMSLEGKSAEPAWDIDCWIADYMANTEKMIRAAKENGVDVWLFDEWGYPTGTAAGKTIAENRDYRSKCLRIVLDVILHDGEAVEFKVNDRFITAYAWQAGRTGTAGAVDGITEPVVPEDGLLRYTARGGTYRVAAAAWDYTSGGTHGVFCDDGREEYGTIDLLSYDAVKCFISNMHERYYKAFGELFGNGLEGFFYDEPFIPYPFPYTSGIFEEFEKKKGYDIVPYLSEMLIPGWYSPENVRHILDYRDIVTDRMAQAFTGQLGEWCAAHGVMLTGHQDLDHSVRGLNTISGDFFKNSEKSDSPGIDYIWNQINRQSFCDYPRFAGSVKHLCGKKHASSESFAVTGYAMPPDMMRWTMEHQIMRGIDKFFLMISEPETKMEHTKLSTDDPQNKLFGRMINERIAAVNRLASEGRPAAEIAVYVPMEEVYIQALKAGHPWMTSTMPHIWEQTDSIAEALCYMPRDYEYIWDGAIISMPVENGGFASPGGQTINTVIMPGGIALPEQTCKKLTEFIRSGGAVVTVGKTVEGLKSGAWLVSCPDALKDIIRSEIFTGCGRVSLAKRVTERGAVYFLLNESDKEQYAVCGGRMFEYSFERDTFDIFVRPGELHFKPGELRIFTAVSAGAVPSFEELSKKDCITIDNWIMRMPNGGAADIGSAMPDWRRFISPVYYGGISFEADFELPRGGDVCIDFGRIKYAAVIRLDGEEYKLPFSPYRLNTILRAGTHHIEMTIYNTEASGLLGTPETERQSLAQHKIRPGCYEQDRQYLAPGFEDAVKIYII
ncbi:MAG: glycosyl hydrolase [Candidatus Ornithomonoglobus sp.]